MNTTIKAKELQPVLYSLNQADEEGFLIFKEDGLEAVVTDPAMVLMEEARIEADNFEEYDVDLEEDHEDLQYDNREGIFVGVNYDLFHKIVKQQSTTDRIEISIEDSEIILDVSDNQFTLPILNLSTEDIPDTGNLEFDTEFKVKVKHFKSALDNLKLFSDSTTMTMDDEENFEMESDGNMGNTVQDVTNYDFEDLREEVDDEEEVVAQSMYALDYLSDIRKSCGKLASNRKKVTFRMGMDFPLKVVCEKSGRKVEFVLAPRIEEE